MRLTARAQKRGHHRSDGPFYGSMSVFIRRLAAPAGFPLPHTATGLPVRLPPYKVWERPLPRSRSRGVSPIHISSQNDFFPLHSICMEKSAYHSPCRCGMGRAGRDTPRLGGALRCLGLCGQTQPMPAPNHKERWSLDPQNKKAVPPRVQQTNLMIPVSIISNCTLPGPGRLPVRHIQAGILTQASSAVLAFPGHSPSDL